MTRFIRNIGIMAHVDAGKTTLTERILYNTGRLHAMGDVHKGTAEMDFRDLEKKHGITISAAATSCEWNGRKISIIDTPGHVDFTIEVERSLRVLDSAVAVFSAVSGVEPQSETVWRQADRFEVPRVCFINKMDNLGANFFKCVDMIRDRLSATPLVLQIPVIQNEQYCGVVDLVTMSALIWEEGAHEPQNVEIPPALVEDAVQYRDALLEQLAEIDDYAMEVYLNDELELQIDDLRKLIRKGCVERLFSPVLCGSAFKNIGVQALLDAIVDYCPSPEDRPDIKGQDIVSGDAVLRRLSGDEPLTALAFKVQMSRYGALTFVRIYSGRMYKGMSVANTTRGEKERLSRILHVHAGDHVEVSEAVAGDIVAVTGLKVTGSGDTLCDAGNQILLSGLSCPDPVIEAVIEPGSTLDQEKMSLALAMIAKEDPSLRFNSDPETGQMLVQGMGELHLDILVESLLEEHNVSVSIGQPRVSYREAITARSRIAYTHRKQDGGAGQFARVELVFEPTPEGKDGLIFEDAIVGGAIPKEYIPSIRKSLELSLQEGVLAGYPMAGLKATLVDGGYHKQDSSGLAFELAARKAFQIGVAEAKPVLLEPMMNVEITTPSDYLGAIIGDLNSRRGLISASDAHGDSHSIVAIAPLANMFGYVNRLRSLSKGRATFTMQFECYAKAPQNVETNVLERGFG